MKLINLFKKLLKIQKKLDIDKLPSRGLFYKDDFEIYIKKVDVQDIIEYEHKYDSDDLGTVIYKLKAIVEKNAIFSEGYSFIDIKSIDKPLDNRHKNIYQKLRYHNGFKY